MLYYQGYKIAGKYGYLEEKEEHVLYACCWLVDNHSTIREAAINCDYSATTLWRRIHNECRQLSPELYGRVVMQMQRNLKRRGKV